MDLAAKLITDRHTLVGPLSKLLNKRMMRTRKSNILKTSLGLVLLVIMLPACTQSSGQNENSSAVTPEMDIHTAVLYGDLATVKQHIEAGTDINSIEPMGGSTPLISAATFDKKDIAKALIAAGADLTIQNKDGSTALHSAAFFCRIEIVQMLLDANVDKSVRNNYGMTAYESITGPFEEIKPVYEMMQQQLSPLGMNLDMDELEEARPVVAMMLQ